MNDFLGDIPTWITTVAVAVALAQYVADRSRRRRAFDREERAQATGLAAWTITDPDPANRGYGVFVRNESGSAFHDVEIRVMLHGQEIDPPVRLTVVPPGEYVVWKLTNERHAWSYPKLPSEEGRVLRPYMNSPKYGVLAMKFADNVNQCWQTDQHAVLSRVVD